MPQKPNHSNDGELQPTNADGTYAPKSGGEGSFESDEKEAKQGLHGDNLKLSAPKSDASVSASKSPSLGFNWKNNPQVLEKMKAYAQKKAEEKQAVLDEEAKKQIEEAEKALGSEGFFNTYKGTYELDPQLVAKATPEEMEALREAILKSEEIIDLTKSHQDYLDNLEKQIKEANSDIHLSWFGFYIKPKLSNVWKGKDTVYPEDYEELKDSIPSKIEYFQNEINSGNIPAIKAEEYKGKIKALNKFAEWGEKAEAKSAVAKVKALEQKLKEAKENSPEDPKALDQYQKVIEKYQNPNALYSITRKNKAIWCQNYEQSSKIFAHEAETQRKAMTQEEIDALTGYTGSGSSTINKPLYGIKYSSGYGDKELAKNKALKSIKLLTSALDKSKSTRDVWLQRGVDSLKIGNVKINSAMDEEKLQSLIGSDMIHPSVMSCGAAKGTGFHSSIIMNIYCPRGTKMHYVDNISHYEGENEMIIGRGYHYTVKKITKSNGHIYIDFDLRIGSDADRLTDEELAKKYEENLK